MTHPINNTSISNRDIFARQALDLVPKILTLQDRNRLSSTYGCFDRSYWHYRIIDFPSGILQEMCWPLALVYALDLPDNPYYRHPSIKEWAIAGIRYAAKSSHPDGSCDDFFPYEKAGGAAAFSLLACAESYQLLEIEDPALVEFFKLRATWLANHHESGRLTNHQALIVRCLDSVNKITGLNEWRDAREARLNRVLEWQDEEGWFYEYEGYDPGYHTFTISLLACVYETSPDPRLFDALQKAIRLASEFVHPDGSYGGEYGSRNTYNFFPHGFELFGRHMPDALTVNDSILKGISEGLFPSMTDDHAIGHYPWNALLAWKDFVEERPSQPKRTVGIVRYERAGIQIRRGPNWDLYIATSKGGVFRFFRDGKCIAADTGISFRLQDNRVAVTHLMGAYEINDEENKISISGHMGWSKQKKMTPFRMILLRVFMLCMGRFYPDLVRKILQRILITGKSTAPFQFKRILKVDENGNLIVEDKVNASNWNLVHEAAIGVDQTSIYVIMSRVFQPTQMKPWQNLTSEIRSLKAGEPLIIKRKIH